ncbi:MAG: pectin acetylesterase-family hydrolase [bacterium]
MAPAPRAPGAVPAAAPAAATKPTTTPDTLTPFSRLSKGWNRIEGGEGTGCAHDSSYVFRVRPGAPEKVLIYLNGGGACWRGIDCDARGRPTTTMSADFGNDASLRLGIFDVSNPLNPVRGYSMMFVSYCTGDVHLGSRTVDYDVHSVKGVTRRFAVQHVGSANTRVVLKWLYANFRAPRVVVVAGTDAGAIASPVVAAQIARHYPRTRVVQLGEGAGGYRAPVVPALFASWGAAEYLRHDDAFRSLDSINFTFTRLYTEAARVAPRVRYAQFNMVGDETQLAFMSQLGVKTSSMSKSLSLDYAEIRQSGAWFRSYTAPGKTHGILRSASLYTTTVDGAPFRTWLSGLIDGDEVQNVGERLVKR